MRNTYAAEHLKLENKLDDLTYLVKQLPMSQTIAKVFEICTSNNYYFDSCPH